MGITEEAGSTARTTIGALTSVPALLVLVILNIATLASAAYIWNAQDKMRYQTMQEMITRCLPLDKGPRP